MERLLRDNTVISVYAPFPTMRVLIVSTALSLSSVLVWRVSIRLPGFKSWLHYWIAMWLKESYLTILTLHFPICK